MNGLKQLKSGFKKIIKKIIVSFEDFFREKWFC